MNPTQQLSATRREYRSKGWIRVLYLLLGLGEVIGFGFGTVKILVEKDSVGLAAITMLFSMSGFYLIALAIRSRLVIDGTRITVRGALKESSADISEIEGFRFVTTRNGSYTQLYVRGRNSKITILQSFKTDDSFRAWLRQVTDLDQRDRDALLDEISRDQELGSTPKERLNALKQAKTRGIIASAVSIAAALAVNLGPANVKLLSAIVLTLAPVAVWMLIQRSPLLYVAFKKRADPRFDLGFVLLAAGGGLTFLISDLEFVTMRPLLYLIIPVALVYVAAYFTATVKNVNAVAAVLVMIMTAGSYSFGLAIAADSLLDNSKATTYVVPVTGKHSSHGKSTTYYLHLAPWGPIQGPNNITVSSSMYSETSIGDQICLGLHPGQLHAPWYQLVDCPDQPSATPNP
jgi:hypothetical protein